ncbi:unnamed protein product [Rhodiola kirilowii]
MRKFQNSLSDDFGNVTEIFRVSVGQHKILIYLFHLQRSQQRKLAT